MKMMLALLTALLFEYVVHAYEWRDPDTGITWKYSLLKDEATIGSPSFSSAIPTSTRGSLVIPSVMDYRYRVTKIGTCAFDQCTELTSVEIPYDVTHVGNSAFRGCTSLKEVRFGGDETHIDCAAFMDCVSLKSLYLPDSLISIGDSAFKNCKGLTEVTIQPGLTIIEASAFYGCGQLTTLTIPSTVTAIGDSAFGACSALSSVVFKSVRAPIMSSFGVFDGVPYDSCQILVRPNSTGWGVDIPGKWGGRPIDYWALPQDYHWTYDATWDGVRWKAEVIGGEATITRCEGGTGHVIIPAMLDGVYPVIGISSGAFQDQTGIGSLDFPASVRVLAYQAFEGCANLQRANFNGRPPEGLESSGLVSKSVELVGHVVATVAPVSGAVFDAVQEVSMGSDENDVVLRYTLDGSDPSSRSIAFENPINITETTTVKVAPFIRGFRWGDVVTATFWHKLPKPLVLSSGEPFNHCGYLVTLSCETEGAEIRYTTDGSDPTEESTLYAEPIPLSNTTIVKAIACGVKNDLPSDIVEKSFMRTWEPVATPIIMSTRTVFDESSQEVELSCAIKGASIFYTIDGSEPSKAKGRVYRGPFRIYDSVTVKAVAVLADWLDSMVASKEFTKNNALSPAINMYDYLPDNDANAPWTVDVEVSHDGVKSVRSGTVNHDGTTAMMVSVWGSGRLSFWWKSECETPDGNYYDYGAFSVGTEQEPRLRIAGAVDWKREEIVFEDVGKHDCKWTYHKNSTGSVRRDCIWVDQVQWLPYGESEYDHTLTTEVPVPYLWLDSYGLGRETDFESAARMNLGKVDCAGRAMSVEDDYVAGTDPTNLTSKLTATIKINTDGRPVLSWKPSLNGEKGDGSGVREGARKYCVYGKRDLGNQEEDWVPVAEGDEGSYHVFKIGVEMP